MNLADNVHNVFHIIGIENLLGNDNLDEYVNNLSF